MSDEPQKWVCTNKDCEHFGEDVVAEGATRVYCVSCREDLALQATVPEDSAKAAKPVSDSLLLEDERRIEEREQKATNASFLAHARTDITLLLSRLKAEREKNEKLMLGLDSALRDLDFDSPRQAKRTLNELLRAAAKESHE